MKRVSGSWTTAMPFALSGSRQASQTLARSAYLLLKNGLLLSFVAPWMAPCAFARAAASRPLPFVGTSAVERPDSPPFGTDGCKPPSARAVAETVGEVTGPVGGVTAGPV